MDTSADVKTVAVAVAAVAAVAVRLEVGWHALHLFGRRGHHRDATLGALKWTLAITRNSMDKLAFARHGQTLSFVPEWDEGFNPASFPGTAALAGLLFVLCGKIGFDVFFVSMPNHVASFSFVWPSRSSAI